jgi:hypothetical protein
MSVKVACEYCGEDQGTSQSYQDVPPYPEKLLVTYCSICDLSFYQEPELTKQEQVE